MSGLKKCERVLDLQSLLSRTEEVGDCLLWQGRVNGRGTAVLRLFGVQTQAVRVAYMFANKKSADEMAGLMTWARCGEKLCINPKHICCGTRAEWRAFRHSIGDDRPKPSTIAKHMVNGRKPGKAKLSLEVVREIRVSKLNCRVLAEKYGVHPDTVAAARSGRTWAEAPSASSIFSWRPAA